MPGWRGWLPWSAAGGLLAAVVALSEVGFALEEGYGLKTLFRLRGAIVPPSDIVVLRLDNDSLSVLRALTHEVGEWPAPLRGCAERHPALVGEILQIAGLDRLPRRLQACVIELAQAAGVATIVYDVAFPASADRVAGTEELAAAIGAHGRVVLREATRREHLPGRTQLDIVTSLHPRLAAVAAGIATARLPDATGRIDQFWVRDRASPAPIQLAGRALEVSLLDTLDGLAQRLGRPAPALGPDARRDWLVATALAVDAAGERLTAAERAAVTALRRVHQGEAHLYFNFYGPPGTLPSLPLWQLLDGSSPVPLAGATLFVGKANLTTSREPDTFETVMTTADGVRMSGVELWATAFGNLRDGTALRTLPEWRRVGVVLALGVLLMLVALSGGVTRSVALTAAVAALWVATAIAAFMLWTLWLPFVGLVVLLPATLLIAELRRFARARRSAARFMPTAVAHRVFDDVEIPTTWLDATVLLTDVVDFATRARRLEAQGKGALRAFQDRHIAMLAAAVRAEGGEVLEQTGDGVLALWAEPDHAAAACRAALAIAATVERDNTDPRAGQPPLRLRIGINSGPVTVGLIGGPERGFLTCSGDTVNMTQRLEALGKRLCPDAPAAAILLGQRTAAALGPNFTVELVTHELLRGHLHAEPVYRLLPEAPVRAGGAVAAAAIALALLLPATVAEAAPSCETPIARLVARAGSVSVDGVPVDPGSTGIPLCADSVVVVAGDSRATLLHLAGDTMFQLDANSRVRLGGPPEPDSGLVELTRGALFFISQVRRILTVRTPSADAGIEGTEVLVAVGEGDAPALDVRVYDGRVALRPGAEPPVEPLPAEPLLAGDRLLVAADGGVELARGDVASLRLAAARELAWTLYYPPLFPDLAAAPVPLAEASRLLAAGRIEEARAVLATVADGSPEAPDRDALLAVIAVAQGEPETALAVADAAVTGQRSAATLLARSYALQALRRLEEARSGAREATEAEPANALAWARLAELELAFGDSVAARRAADRSVATGAVPLVHVVQGFARLAAFDAQGAQASFATALDADSNQPLAHLGRGLALIRRNELEEGRRGLEAAAALDPARSLLRSYLGKAYFEERRDAAAADQLRIAKQLDPDDPTPWLYGAIHKQLTNRPVEALRDLERSIALNENRATFRSGLLLDEDLAVRSVGRGRLFDDLGFSALGIAEAQRAIATDVGGFAAHRFLADLYLGLPRLEIARVSELLQSQLLQPPNFSPMQPSLAISDLNAIDTTGPARPALNDFGPMFVREGVSLSGSGLTASNDTVGGEAVATALIGPAVTSAAAFSSRTDGFRRNNDSDDDVQGLFGQIALSPELSLQAEYRNRDSQYGDLELRLPPGIGSQRIDIEQRTGRFGGRARLGPGSDVIASLILTDRDEEQNEPQFGFDTTTRQREDGYQIEGQHLVHSSRYALRTGAGLYRFNVDRTTEPFTPTTTTERNHYIVYGYLDWRLTETVDVTLGLAGERYEQGEFTKTRMNPKLGLRWQPTERVQVRAAAYRGLKRALAADQTIEPTAVAGINQLFDDFNATEVDAIGGGVDVRLAPNLFTGLDVLHRDLAVPIEGVLGEEPILTEDEQETWVGGYLGWLFDDRWALSVGYRFQDFDRDRSFDDDDRPLDLRTHWLPATLRYFHPSGWFASLGVTLVHQDGTYQPEAVGGQHYEDTFLTTDLALGYRLPGRRGLISVVAQNIFDEGFSYQDQNFLQSETRRAEFVPERRVLGRLTIRF